MKQIGLGFMQYAQDYGERYPAGRSCQVTITSCLSEELNADTNHP
jgi:hypothetical protein